MKKIYFKYLFALLLSVSISAVLQAQNFHIVKDINNSKDANPFGYAELQGVKYFSADDGIHGQELWRSDGTAEGTYLVKDVTPGEASSNIYEIIVSNNQLFFTANSKLWVSDGSDNGTIMLSGPNGVWRLSDIKGEVYFFAAANGNFNNSIWKSDGTETGTVQYVDLTSFSGFGDNSIILTNGHVLFNFYSFNLGRELWRTDGTIEGTYILKDINTSGDSDPYQFTVIDTTLYFSAYDGTNSKLWKSDGTSEGTTIVTNDKAVVFPRDYYNRGSMVAINSTLYFSANASTRGEELYKYDTKTPGIVLVKDIAAGSDSSNPANLTNVNGSLFFSATGTDGNTGLWKSDGTSAGTALIKNIDKGSGNSFSNLFNANGELYFTYQNKSYGSELWKSNGTDAGTQILKDIYPGVSSSNPRNFTFVNNQVLFSANNGSTGIELWKSNGSATGTSLLKDINQTSTSASEPSNLTGFNNNLFFTAFEKAHGKELWKSDGTEAGTSLYKDIIPGDIGSSPSNITPQKDNLYFFTNADTLKLWKTNGNDGTITLVKTFSGSNLGISYSFGILAADDQIYFSISDFKTGQNAVWRSDGTEQGTYLLKSHFHYSSSAPAAVVGNNIFVADVTDTSAALWKSDGTVAGTVLVRSFHPGGPFYEIDNLQAFNREVFFGADGGEGLSFWKSDGTEAGTVLLKQIWRPGIYGYTISNGTLFFDADDNSGRHLWKTDGTTEGTKLVKKIGPYGSSPEDLTDVNGILYFTANANDYSANDTGHGRELYRSDGTEAGTYLVKDITPGLGSTNFSSYTGRALVNGNGTLFFTIFNETYTNIILWQSNGTEAGTHPVQDDNLNGVTSVSNVTAVGTQLFFTATTYQFGTELYTGNLRALPVTLINFSGEVQGKQNFLHWTTATEQNNTGFEIQRSSDGNNFNKIGFANTKAINGNSNNKITYDFTDADYLASTNYYRLKQIDKDGKFSYSNIVVLKDNNAPASGLSAVYPNPAKNTLNVKIASQSNHAITLMITDLNGKSLLNKITNISNGESIVQLNVAQLSSGTYFLKIFSADGKENTVKKFVKQ